MFKLFIELNERKKESQVTQSSQCWLFETPWTVAYQAPPSMEFSRQEYRSGLPFPFPENLLGLPHCRQALYSLSHHGSPDSLVYRTQLPTDERNKHFSFQTRPPEARLQALHTLILSATPPLCHCLTTPHQVPQGWDTGVRDRSPLCLPSVWQSNKAILFYFTQNSDSEVQLQYWRTDAKFSAPVGQLMGVV